MPRKATAGLTPREYEIVGELLQELTTPKIAEKLELSPHTVHSMVRSIRRKLGVRSQVGIVVWALRKGGFR